MNRIKKTQNLIALLAVAAVLMLSGCGNNEAGGAPTIQRSPTYPSAGGGLGVYDLNDFEVTDIGLKVSPEYNETTGMVDVYMVVTDQDDNTLEFLNKYNFVVTAYVGTLPREVDLSPVNVQLTPVITSERVVALALDSSGSMTAEDNTVPGATNLNEAARFAAKQYVDLMGATDKTAIIDFDSEAILIQELTSNRDLLKEAIDEIDASGGTNVFDAVHEAVNALGARPGRRAAVVMTDGETNADYRDGLEPSIEAAKRAGIPVFTVGLGSSATDSESQAYQDLVQISVNTGGMYIAATDGAALSQAFMNTIPQAVNELPEMSALRLSINDPASASVLPGTLVQLVVTATYENGIDKHRATASGNYIIN